jgi:hypothetical protein
MILQGERASERVLQVIERVRLGESKQMLCKFVINGYPIFRLCSDEVRPSTVLERWAAVWPATRDYKGVLCPIPLSLGFWASKPLQIDYV